MRKFKSCPVFAESLERRMLLSGVTYNRNAAVAYADQYAYEVVSDGYFWINGSTYTYYGAGSPVPVNAANEDGGIGDDCAHFVSSCIGKPTGGTGGGLSIPSRVPPTYGEPAAARLDELLVNDGYAEQVSSVSQLQPGDVIGYDWDGSGGGSMSGIDHTVIYLGNGEIAAHSTSHLDETWNWGNSRSTITFFIHITLPDSISPNTPTNSSPANNIAVATLTPKLTASAFSDGAIASSQTGAQWRIYSGSTLLYDSGTDATDLTSLTVPSGKLSNGATYTWKVRYEDNYGDWSGYSATTAFMVQSSPAVLTLSGSQLYVKVDPDQVHLDVWNNSTDAGSPSQQFLLNEVTTVIVDGSSTGSDVVLDFSNGSPAPAGQVTILGSGTSSNNPLSIIGSASGNDAVTAQNGNLTLNGNMIVYTDVAGVQFTPGAGTDSVSVGSGTLQLGGTANDSLSALTVSSGATLDLGAAILSVEYPAGNDPAAGLQSQIDSSTIFSSLVNADASHTSAVGLFDDGSEIIIRATWQGDANCDDVINADDISLMLSQPQNPTAWTSGDFNHDRQINADDWMALEYAMAYSAGRNFDTVFAAGTSVVESILSPSDPLAQAVSP